MTTYAGSFAGVWISHRPYAVHVALVTGADAGGIPSLANSAGLHTSPTVSYSPRSLNDLLALARQVTSLGLEADINVDVPTDQVQIWTMTPSAASTAVAALSTEPDAIEVVSVPRLSEPSTNLYGGLGGSNTGGTWRGCPSGFDVQQRVGGPDDFIYGFITAGHCTTTNTWNGITLPYVGSCFHTTCDSQFHSEASYTAVPQFYWQSGSLRYVTATSAWSSLVVGQTVCKFGENTGYGCALITTKTIAPGYVPNASAVFVGASNNCASNMTLGGDSGSPVYYSTTALGIISGDYITGSCPYTNMIFDAINYATAYSGMSVMLH